MSCRLLLVCIVTCLSALSGVSACGIVIDGKAYDFSPLTLASGSYNATDSQYYYKLNVCGVVDAGNSGPCQQKKGAVCQYQGAQFVSMDAAWTGPSSSTWSAGPDGTIVQRFANGEACFPTPNPRTTTISYVCGASKLDGITVENTRCNYGITVKTNLACGSKPPPPSTACGFTASGHTYDFSKLTVAPGDPVYNASSPGQYQYAWNVCGVAAAPGLTACSNKNGMLCQFSGGRFVSMDAAWLGSQKDGVWAETVNGATFTTKNGDACFPTANPRVAVFDFQCGTKPVESVSVTSTSPCSYKVTMLTSYACKN